MGFTAEMGRGGSASRPNGSFRDGESDVASRIVGPGAASDPEKCVPSRGAVFATAGRGATIAISEESAAKAEALFRDGSSEFATAGTTDPRRDRGWEAGPTRGTDAPAKGRAMSRRRLTGSEATAAGAAPPGLAASFATAGTASAISVSEEGMARANRLFGDGSDGNARAARPPGALVGEEVVATHSERSGKQSGTAQHEDFGPQKVVQDQTNGIRRTFMTATADVGRARRVAPNRLKRLDSNRQSQRLAQASNRKDESAWLPTSADEKVETKTAAVAPLAGTDSQTTVFVTAGKGKTIQASEEALERADRLLNKPGASSELHTLDDEGGRTQVDSSGKVRDTSALRSPASSVAPALFSTAGSWKSIAVSSEGLAKAAEIFGEPEPLHSHRPQDQMAMFATAGKEATIHVSEEGLERANHLFQQSLNHSKPRDTVIERTEAAKLHFTEDVDSASACSPLRAPLFATGGKGKSISVSTEGMAMAARVLGGESSANLPQAGFATAGKGAAIQVSDDAMDKADRLFAGTLNEDLSAKVVESSSSSPPRRAPQSATAGSSKSTSVSSKGLARATQVLGGGSSAYPPAAGFTTAGKGSTIKVSDDARDKAERLFAGTANEDPSSKVVESAASSPPRRATQLATAGSSNSVSVSREGSARAALVLGGGSNAIPPVVGFATAGRGSPIKVSDDAMDKADRLFAGTDVNSAASSSCCRAPLFATAGSGKSISVSSEGMAKAAQMISDSNEPLADFSIAANGSGVQLFDDTMDKNNSPFDIESQEGSRHLLPSTEGKQAIAGAPKFHIDTKSVGSNDNSTHRFPCPVPQFGIAAGKSISVVEGSTVKAMVPLAKSEGNASPIGQAKVKETHLDEPGRDVSMDNASVLNMTRALTSEVASAAAGNTSTLAHTAVSSENSSASQRSPVATPVPFARVDCADNSCAVRDTSCSKTSRVLFHDANGSAQPVARANEAMHASSKRLFPGENTERKNNSLVLAPTGGDASHNKPTNDNENSNVPCDASTTPKQTPKVLKPPAVTLSTNVKNPYARTRHAKVGSHYISPVPFKFYHIEGKFRGKQISPTSIKKAVRVLLPMIGSETDSSQSQENERNECRKKINWEGVKSKHSLSEFASKYGPMQNCPLHCLRHGVNTTTLKVNSTNATKVRFDAETGLPCLFFGEINASKRKLTGKITEIRQSLLEFGCDESLLSNDKWILNHVRWIVWKLAAMEQRFPDALGGRYFTYSRLLLQLKKRYEKELRGAKRPALKKLLNRDAAASRLMILCVSQILRVKMPHKPSVASATKPVNSQTQAVEELKLELTDGWYSMPAVLDPILTSFVKEGKIAVGSKLVISNAHMLGADEGVDPLDLSYNPSHRSCPVALKITANASRLAKWDAPLGFVSPSPRIRSQEGLLLIRALSDVIPGGGMVPLIDLVVCRKYPRLFLVQCGVGQTNDATAHSAGESQVLNEAQEDFHQKDFEKRRHGVIEKAAETAEKDAQKEVDDNAPVAWKDMLSSNSPNDFYEKLSKIEKNVIDGWAEKRVLMIQDIIRKSVDQMVQDDISLFRQSVPFVRVFVKSLQQGCKGAILTIWRATEEQHSVLTEGTVVRLKNLTVRPTRHNGMLQLTASNKTCMESLSVQPSLQELVLSGYKKRSYMSFVHIHLLSKKTSPTSGIMPEVDIVGYLLKIKQDGGHGWPLNVRLYLTDESGLILRVQREFVDSANDPSVAVWNEANSTDHLFAFRDVKILPFDSSENCAVAVWTQTASQVSKKGCRRLRDIHAWSESACGKQACHKALCALDAGVSTITRLPPSFAIGIGYICSFSRGKASSCNSPLHAMVDCGMNCLLVVEFPLFLLDEALDLCAEQRGSRFDKYSCIGTNCNEDVSETLEELTNKVRGSLFHFLLKRQPVTENSGIGSVGDVQVLKLRKADLKALTNLYLLRTELQLGPKTDSPTRGKKKTK